MDVHPIAAVKAHPWIAGAAVGVVLLFFVLKGSGGGGGAAVASGGDASADQLGAAQIAAQTTVAGYQASADASAAHDASQLELAKLSSDYAQTHDALTAQVALSQIASAANVTNTANTLAAGVQSQQLQTSEHLATINTNAQILNTQNLTNALIHQTDQSAATSQAAIQAQQNIATQSWWDRIFG